MKLALFMHACDELGTAIVRWDSISHNVAKFRYTFSTALQFDLARFALGTTMQTSNSKSKTRSEQ
jgi:hypothetical protein